ncbi:hypothetical protein GCM10009645_31880 [Mycolicibacterium poriferae]|uniref:Ferredoxin n=1 Tax=Mycolicibacterium poriferae TaxID=39694 RepID=A0A6N4VCU2_9MYCO|nr:ferredoxin [Mycolicibacterium poriferae]MCV7265191.1 ferredoxin [Mycolicibacterium poriferae]BBX51890.1 hypothetical protein MPOR_29160 [Mycolicibacterium poriferae]
MSSTNGRVVVDPQLCEGHALCLESAPELFDLSDDDVATCIAQPTAEQWPLVHAAIDACPRGAISIVED